MYRLLRYGGQAYNNFTIDTHGVITNTKTGNTLRKLSDSDVMFIRNHSGKLSYKKLSNMFGVSTTTIRNVIRRISYADL